MDVERIIDDIEQLQEMFEAPDIRPLSASDISAANRRHDEMLAHSPWFRLGSGMASVAEPSLQYSDCRKREIKLPANGREKWRRRKPLVCRRNLQRLNKTCFRTLRTDTSLKLIPSAATPFFAVEG